jgi:3-hydroxyacyl-CoA dehydrogenase
MIVSGAVVPGAQFKGTPLLDEVTDGDPLPAALALADASWPRACPLKRVRDLKVKDPQAEAFLQFARNTVGAASKQFPAPLKCVEAVAVPDKPFDEGLRLEREIFMGLMSTPESRALRHMFTAERAASKMRDVPDDTPLRTVAKVGVIGAGTMGGGITMNFLNAGIPVVLLEMKQEALDKGLATIRRNYENSAKKGKLTRSRWNSAWA